MAAAHSRRAALVLLAIASTAAGSGLLISQLSREEGDRRAVRALVRDIEKGVRAHDGSIWLLVEGAFPPGQSHAAIEPLHERRRAKLDRLSHLEDVQLGVGNVDVAGSSAWAERLGVRTR